jgi:hypothetical protein
MPPPPQTNFFAKPYLENGMFKMANYNMCYLCINKNLKVLIMGTIYAI